MSLFDTFDDDDDDVDEEDEEEDLRSVRLAGGGVGPGAGGLAGGRGAAGAAVSGTAGGGGYGVGSGLDTEASAAAAIHAAATAATGGVDPEEPIFSLEPVGFQAPAPIQQIATSSDVLVMALTSGHLLRLNLQHAEKIDNVPVSRRGDKIHRVFIDPTGQHVLVAMNNDETYYLHARWEKPRLLSKLRGVRVESVAWDRRNTSAQDTSEILVGTSQGHIYETSVTASDKGFLDRLGGTVGKSSEAPFRLLFKLPEPAPVTGLLAVRFPDSDPGPAKFFVLAATNTRIYQFVGGPTFEALFHSHDDDTPPSFMELPAAAGGRDGEPLSAELHWYSPHRHGMPQSFAWLAGPGVFHGSLVFGSQEPGDSVLTDTALLQYSSVRRGAAGDARPPLSMALTEWHFLLIDNGKFQAVNKLSERVVHEQALPAKGGRVRGLAVDGTTGTLWAYAEHAVYEVLVAAEDRDAWRLLVDGRQFAAALRHCKTDEQRDAVTTAQAEHYFAQGSYELAAQAFGQSRRSFEEMALRFLKAGERTALRRYLLAKLEGLRRDKQMTQVTIVCTWLTEIYLDSLNDLDNRRLSAASRAATASAAAAAAAAGNESPAAAASDGGARATTADNEAGGGGGGGADTLDTVDRNIELVSDEFHRFLEDNRNSLDDRTTFNLIAAHGRMDDLLRYAEIIEDYDRVLSHHAQRREWSRALDVLSRQTNAELYYKFSPALMSAMPYETVNVWMSAHDQARLDPARLLPALMQRAPGKAVDEPADGADVVAEQAIRYLEHCIYKLNSADPVIYNCLLSLYARQPREDELLRFLERAETLQSLDLKYALRQCTRHRKQRACVLVYAALGLFEEAVDLALSVDIELARQHADRPEDDPELRRKLWLRIARHVVENERDIKRAMSFLSACELLKIEDILPFFPDFTVIDDFKEEICASLEDYNQHIEELKHEMADATKSANLIRRDVRELRNKHGVVSGAQRCEFCLFGEVSSHMSEAKKRHVKELQSKLTAALHHNGGTGTGGDGGHGGAGDKRGGGGAGGRSLVDRLRVELDELIAASCPLCGDIICSTISDPFITDPAEIESWAV